MKNLGIIILSFIGTLSVSYSQCPTVVPTGIDTCRIGTGTTQVGASGSTGLYSWYSASTGGTYLGSGNSYTTPSISTTTNYYVAAGLNDGLNFDGANDYVAIQNYAYSSAAITEVTVEAWVRTVDGTDQMIASFDRSEYWRLSINGNGAGTGQVGWNVRTNLGIFDFYSNSRVDDGSWHHVAGVFDNGLISIYIDGELDAQTTNGTTMGTGATRFGFISAGSEATTFNGTNTPFWPFNGDIDEVRIWNTARSQTEIQNNMAVCLTGSETGLDVYYPMNDGTGSSTITDLAGSNNGSLINMNNSTDWIQVDRDYSCPTCESGRTEVTATVSGGTPLNLGPDIFSSCSASSSINLDAGSGYANYLWNTLETSQSITVTNSGNYIVIADDGAGCYDSDTIFISKPTGPAASALNFDGGNDCAAISNLNYSSSTITEVTVEAWIKTSQGGNQIIASYDRSEYWRLGVNGDGAGTGQISWNLRTNAGILDFGSTSTIHDGNWHHVVGVYDNGLASIYIDGVLDAQVTQGTMIGTGALRYGFIGTGSEANSFNGSKGPNNEFNGDIDELRIWNIAKSENEIRALMCTSFDGPQNGLDAYFLFNDGTGSVTITDIANGNDATLINMNSGSDWVTSGAPIGNSSVFLYPGSWSGQTLSITSCDGDQIEIENVSGSLNGIHLYAVEEDPSEQTDILTLTSGNHYYGIFQTGSGTETYDLNYIYTNHPLLTSSNESSLFLSDRNDNSDSPWVESLATQDEANDVLSQNFSGRQEIIVDSKEFIWTGLISTDWNTAGNWTPIQVPPVDADIKIPSVTNLPILDMDRNIGGLNIEANASVDLNSFNLSLIGNLLQDGDIISNLGTLTFNNATKEQFLTLNNLLSIDNLTIDNPLNVSVSAGSIDLFNTLTVSSGSFETNSELTIKSNPSGTGRIAEITGTGITGDITMERYIDSGETYWRFFSSAVQGATIDDYQDDFITAGYPGSPFPNFGWVSIYNYDETLGAGLGYVPVSSSAQILNTGEGFMVWSGDTITGTQPFTVDLKGVPNQGNISLPVTFTNTGTATEDGWNLVGNPYASTIDWEATGWTKTNMGNATYILNPDNEQYATYVNGASVNGGSRYIASQQAFWVFATANSPSLTATESVKSSTDQAFLKSGLENQGMKITVNGFGMTDECIVRHIDDATDSYDPAYDAYKIYASSGNFPHISLISSYNEDLVVHSFDKEFQEWDIPLKITVYQTGFYDLYFNEIAELNVPCLKLEDTYTGQMYSINEGQALNFELSDTTTLPRFILHLGKDYDNTIIPATCFAATDGAFELDLEDTSLFNYSLSNGNSTITGSGFGSPLTLSNLNSGAYNLIVNGISNLCNQSSFEFYISEPNQLQVSETVTDVMTSNDGAISLNITGGTAPYSIDWNNNETTLNIDNLSPNDYTVQITDANNCFYTDTYSVNSHLSINENSMTPEFTYNSSENTILITNSNFINTNNIMLYSITGELIKTYNLNADETTQNLLLPINLASGTYLLRSSNSPIFYKFARIK